MLSKWTWWSGATAGLIDLLRPFADEPPNPDPGLPTILWILVTSIALTERPSLWNMSPRGDEAQNYQKHSGNAQ